MRFLMPQTVAWSICTVTPFARPPVCLKKKWLNSIPYQLVKCYFIKYLHIIIKSGCLLIKGWRGDFCISAKTNLGQVYGTEDCY